MGEKYKDKWYDFLPWILLMKRTSYQKQLGASPAMLTYGTSLAVPGDLLRDPGLPFSEPELEELVKYMGQHDNKPPIQTDIPPQEPIPEPPLSVTHVYTKQYKTPGLSPSFVGPFPIEERISRSQVKIRVGYNIKNEPRFEIRNWKDLKICEVPPDITEASRPKRGRPSKASAPSEADNATDESVVVNKLPANEARQNQKPQQTSSCENSNGGGKRSTRNPNPVYVASITGPPPRLGFPRQKAWSASASELEEINRSIVTSHRMITSRHNA